MSKKNFGKKFDMENLLNVKETQENSESFLLDKEERFKTSLDINKDLHRRLKILSANLGKSLKNLIEDFLWDGIKKYEK